VGESKKEIMEVKGVIVNYKSKIITDKFYFLDENAY